MNEPLILKTVRDTGHLWDPSYPDVLNVTPSSFDKIKIRDRVARDAIASMQRSDANFEDLVREEHNRAPIYDGEVGPATMRLVEGWVTKGGPLERCPIPDFVPPPNATFRFDDPQLQKAVESMQIAAATGSGSIPVGCYGTAGVHEVKAAYDLSKLSSNQKEWFPEIKARNIAECAAMGLKIIEVPVGQKTNIDFYGRSFGGGTIGMAGFLGQSCGNNVFCTITPSYAPDLEMVLVLTMHEHGHCWNFNHRPGYIMNPSIRRVKPKWVERDAAGVITYADPSYTADGKRFFGGGPLTPIVVPPPPPPDDFGVTFGDLVTTNSKGVSKIFSVVPKGTKPGPNPFPG